MKNQNKTIVDTCAFDSAKTGIHTTCMDAVEFAPETEFQTELSIAPFDGTILDLESFVKTQESVHIEVDQINRLIRKKEIQKQWEKYVELKNQEHKCEAAEDRMEQFQNRCLCVLVPVFLFVLILWIFFS